MNKKKEIDLYQKEVNDLAVVNMKLKNANKKLKKKQPKKKKPEDRVCEGCGDGSVSEGIGCIGKS